MATKATIREIGWLLFRGMGRAMLDIYLKAKLISYAVCIAVMLIGVIIIAIKHR